MNGSLILHFLAVLLLIHWAKSYGAQITISSATQASITNFYQDFSTCPCDISPLLCDNYCCCDSLCSSVPFPQLRQQWQLGPTLTPASQPLSQSRVSAPSPHPLAMVHSKISPVYIPPTEGQSAATTKASKLPPSTTPLLANCNKNYIQCLHRHQHNQPKLSDRSQ
jgi:hypothetical protein